MKKKKHCPFEKKVSDCLKKSKFDPEMKQHIRECALCNDTVTVHRWMGNFNKVSMQYQEVEKKLPAPDLIWEKAHSLKRIDKELVKKAMKPLLIPQILTYIAITIGVAFLLIINLDVIKEFFINNFGPLYNFFDLFVSKISNASYFIIIPFILIISSIVFSIFYSIFRPEEV